MTVMQGPAGAATQMQSDQEALPALFERLSGMAIDFLSDSSSAPVVNTAARRPALDAHMPNQGQGAAAAIAEYWQAHRDAHSRSTGPRYFGFVTGGVTPAALAADWLVSVLDQNVATERHSIAAFIELQTLTYIADLLGLPPNTFHGLLTTGATAANLVGLAAAREWCGQQAGVRIARDGLASSAGITVFGCAPHSSIVKVLGILGLGQDKIRRVAAQSGREAIDLQSLSDELRACQTEGRIVIASAGTVDTADFDDLGAVAELCKAHGAWLHIDAAFGAFARVSSRFAGLAKHLELADSITLDAHKWLNVPYDCGIALTRHPQIQEAAFSADAPYVPMDSALPAYMNRGVEQSRRYRALPLYLSLKAYGRDGYRALIERNCDFAKRLSDWIDGHAAYTRLAETRLNIVLFCVAGATESECNVRTKALVTNLNASGALFVTPTTYRGRVAIRFAVSNWMTSDRDFEIVSSALAAFAAGKF